MGQATYFTNTQEDKQWACQSYPFCYEHGRNGMHNAGGPTKYTLALEHRFFVLISVGHMRLHGMHLLNECEIMSRVIV